MADHVHRSELPSVTAVRLVKTFTLASEIHYRVFVSSLLQLIVEQNQAVLTLSVRSSAINTRTAERIVLEICIAVKKVKFALEQAMKAQRGSIGIALLFL